MKFFVSMFGVAILASTLAWCQEPVPTQASLVTVSAKHRHAKHHAHKAAKHRQPKHHHSSV